jgi:O-antigen/teichoic acid export membrane protein
MLWRVGPAMGKIRELSIYTLVIQLLNLALNILLVKGLGYGAYGSALSTLIVATLGLVVLQIPLGLRLVEATFSEWLRETMLPGAVPALVGGVGWFMLQRFAPPQSWVALALCFMTGALLYLAGLAASMKPEDWADLNAFSRKIRSLCRFPAESVQSASTIATED